MISSPPKFRSDLKISRQDTDRGTFFIVKNPVSNSFFRLRETEQFIAHQFDGKTSLEQIRKRTEEKFEASLSPEVLDAFIKNLEKSGLLEIEEAGEKRAKNKRLAGSILYLRYKFLDPARLFDRLIGVVRFCFTPWFVVFSALTILTAAATLIGSWGEYTQDLHQLYRLSAVPVFIALSFLTICTHECAHGLTCKYFGGEVHEIGFLLVYFQPALYCNVSDAWLFPERRKRLWVGFAGPYFELFVWAMAVLAWRLTETETWINYAALMVMTSSGVKTLLNFNPFIKLDGYYLLSDFLEIPNLRRKSFRYIGCLIERVLGGHPSGAKELSPRERKIFLAYGLVATVSSFLLICYVFLKAGGLLIDNGQPAAFLISIAFLGLKLRRRLRRIFGKVSDPSDPSDDGENLSTATHQKGQAAAQPKKKRKSAFSKRRIVRTAVLAAAAGLLYLGLSSHVQLQVSGPFNVLPIDNSDARVAVEGIIDKIYVDEGDKVKAGQLIARLSDKDLRAELDKTEAEIRATSAKLRMLQAGPTQFQIDVAKTAVTKADDRLKYTQNRELRIKGLYEEHLRARNEYEDSKELAIAAENDLAESKSRLDLLLSGTRPEEIDATSAQLDRLETERRYLREQLRLLNVLSPSTGIVATPSRQLKEMRHMLVKKGDLILKVYDFKAVTAQILVPEKNIDGVRVGETVVLRARAYPGAEFHGTVTSIAISAAGSSESGPETPLITAASTSSTGANKTILVTTEIENRDLLLKSEMTGFAKISCGQRRVIDLIARRIGRTVKVEFWSLW